MCISHAVVPGFIVTFSLAPRYQNYIHTQLYVSTFIVILTILHSAIALLPLPTHSCRVYSFSFWIGLLIPFGIIYIVNWIIFILIFASLLCRPNVKNELGGKGRLRKLKENFIIALGLSLLFGMSWAVGLLASSDLPDAVRHPAAWVFTLATAFLGVYLFILYVPRSLEARQFWKQLLLCKSKNPVSRVYSTNPTSLRQRWTATSTLRSWARTLLPNRLRLRQASNNTGITVSTLTHNPSSNQYSAACSTAGMTVHRNSSYAEPSSLMETSNTTRLSSPHMPAVEIELLQQCKSDGESHDDDEANPVAKNVETESLAETMVFGDGFPECRYIL